MIQGEACGMHATGHDAAAPGDTTERGEGASTGATAVPDEE